MRILEISTALGCSVKCVYCHTLGWHKPEVMTMDAFLCALETVPVNVHVSFAGFAEPWQNPDCTKMVQEAVKHGYSVSVFSTLKGMSKADADILSGVSWDNFCIHLPDSTMNVPITEEYLYVLSVMSKAKNASYMRFGWVPEAVENIVGEIELSMPDHRICGRVFGETKRRHGEVYCGGSGDRNADHNVLLPDGTVVLCCQDVGKYHVLGNLLTQTYDEIRQGEEVKKVQEGMTGKEDVLCHYCVYSKEGTP